jgi:Protein of unknown function (DUF1629)
MANLPSLLQGRPILAAPPGRRGFPDYPEPPRLLMDTSLGRAPTDVEQYHEYWLVSDRLKELFDRIDPEGLAFVKCETLPNDGRQGPGYWLCDVVRILDALDEDKSDARIKLDPQSHKKFYDIVGSANLVFREQVVGSAHVFRMRYLWPLIICDQDLKDACREAGIRGTWFRDAVRS